MKKRKLKHLIVKNLEEFKIEFTPQFYKEEILDILSIEEHIEYYVRRNLRKATDAEHPKDDPKSKLVSKLEKLDSILK